MSEKDADPKPTVHVEGDIKDSNIVIGNNNIVTSIRNYVFRDTRQLLLSILIFLLLFGGGTGAYWYSKQPQKMTGNYNIAIARFGEIQSNGSITSSAKAETIRNVLFNFMDSEYRASGLGLTVQISQKNMPYISGSEEAALLAEKIDADIVVFGNISVQGDQAELIPRFYIVGQADTDELTGQNELGLPIGFNPSELGSQDQINQELRLRTEILFYLTKALIYTSQDNLDSALRAAQTAISTAENMGSPFPGQEVLYLVASQILVAKNDYSQANSMLDESLALNPQYARAYLARGNIYYLLSETDRDPQMLEEAFQAYQLAYEMPNQPEGAYIPVKAHIGLGNVFLLKAQRVNDPNLIDKAIGEYEYVISEYSKTQDPFLKKYASIAYFGRAVSTELYGYEGDQSRNDYQMAWNLSEDPAFRDKIQQETGIDAPHDVSPPVPPPSGDSRQFGLFLLVVCSIVLLVLIAVSFPIIRWIRRRPRKSGYKKTI